MKLGRAAAPSPKRERIGGIPRINGISAWLSGVSRPKAPEIDRPLRSQMT
jgi:hypothetical protein